MGTVIEINDILDELRNENKRLSKSICLTKKCFILLEKYKNCLNSYQSQCKCIDSKSDINSLEIEYKKFLIKISDNLNNHLNDITVDFNEDYYSLKNIDEYDSNLLIIENNFISGHEVEVTADYISDDLTETESVFNEENAEKERLESIEYLRNRPKRKVKRIKVEDNHFSDNNESDVCEEKSDKRDKDFDITEYGDKDMKEVKNENKMIGNKAKVKSEGKSKPKSNKNSKIDLKLKKKTKLRKSENYKQEEREKRIEWLATKPWIPCPYPGCEYKTRMRNDMRKHEQLVHKDKESKNCILCDKQIHGTRNYFNHVYKCSKGLPFVCDWDQCKACFQSKNCLDEHKCTHTGVKPCICDWPGCDSRFADINKLKRHRIVHIDDRPYACHWPGCDAKFKRNYFLKVHIKAHSGEKEFVCHCGMRFINNGKLRRHLNTKKHNKNFRCDWPECELRFYSENKLRQHIDKHLNSGEEEFQCKLSDCGLKFRSKKKLNKHLKEHENNLKNE